MDSPIILIEVTTPIPTTTEKITTTMSFVKSQSPFKTTQYLPPSTTPTNILIAENITNVESNQTEIAQTESTTIDTLITIEPITSTTTISPMKNETNSEISAPSPMNQTYEINELLIHNISLATTLAPQNIPPIFAPTTEATTKVFPTLISPVNNTASALVTKLSPKTEEVINGTTFPIKYEGEKIWIPDHEGVKLPFPNELDGFKNLSCKASVLLFVFIICTNDYSYILQFLGLESNYNN